jgi:hypothetical protein
MATVCAWCPAIHILKIQRRDVDVIVAFQQGRRLTISRNGVELQISDGICAPCRAKHFPETVKRKETQP